LAFCFGEYADKQTYAAFHCLCLKITPIFTYIGQLFTLSFLTKNIRTQAHNSLYFILRHMLMALSFAYITILLILLICRAATLNYHHSSVLQNSISQLVFHGTSGFRKRVSRVPTEKMRNSERVLLAVLNLYVRIKICMASFDSNPTVTDRTQTISRCFSPEDP
jgi:hypothetical protein